MKYDHNPFENQIFDHFRKEENTLVVQFSY